MNFKSATNSQLLTIAYHEPCSPVDRVKALQELNKRGQSAYGKVNAKIKRKLS